MRCSPNVPSSGITIFPWNFEIVLGGQVAHILLERTRLVGVRNQGAKQLHDLFFCPYDGEFAGAKAQDILFFYGEPVRYLKVYCSLKLESPDCP